MLNNFEPYKLPLHGVRFPKIDIAEEDYHKYGAKSGCTNHEFLVQICRNGFKEKIQSIIPKEKQKWLLKQTTIEAFRRRSKENYEALKKANEEKLKEFIEK